MISKLVVVVLALASAQGEIFDNLFWSPTWLDSFQRSRSKMAELLAVPMPKPASSPTRYPCSTKTRTSACRVHRTSAEAASSTRTGSSLRDTAWPKYHKRPTPNTSSMLASSAWRTRQRRSDQSCKFRSILITKGKNVRRKEKYEVLFFVVPEV